MEQILSKIVETYWNIRIKEFFSIRNADKKIAEIKDARGNVYIVKGEKNDCQKVNEICEFANVLRVILPVPAYIQTVHSAYAIEQGGLTYTLEQKVTGIEAKFVTDRQLYVIGKALGKMHRFSLEHSLRLHQATAWSMFGGNKTDRIGDYDENELSFVDFENAFYDEPLHSEIKALYMKHRDKLEKNWPALPMAATQGDFCPYNMLFDDTGNIAGIFDFNLAGDEVLVNECIAVGVYVSWHIEYVGELDPAERFEQFIAGYTEERAFTDLEIEVIPPLFSIIRAFRYDRVDEGIEDAANKTAFMDETLNLLKSGDRAVLINKQ